MSGRKVRYHHPCLDMYPEIFPDLLSDSQIFWRSIYHKFWQSESLRHISLHSIWTSMGRIFWHSICQKFWNSIWFFCNIYKYSDIYISTIYLRFYIFHIFWHSICHEFWHSICHIFWHVIWQSVWRSDILLDDTLSNILWILSDILSEILTETLSDIHCDIYSGFVSGTFGQLYFQKWSLCRSWHRNLWSRAMKCFSLIMSTDAMALDPQL